MVQRESRLSRIPTQIEAKGANLSTHKLTKPHNKRTKQVTQSTTQTKNVLDQNFTHDAKVLARQISALHEQKCIKDEREEHANTITKLIQSLVSLELEIEKDHWSQKKVIEKELRQLGVNPADTQGRLFNEICAHLGVNLASIGGNKVRGVGKDAFRKKAFACANDPELVPGFITQKRDAVFYGESGTGKTNLTLLMIKAMLEESIFGDRPVPATAMNKKILWIGPDGGNTSLSQMQEYLYKMNLIDKDWFMDNVEWWLEDPEEGTASWNLSTSNLIKLKKELENGSYCLVVVDSLKAACSGTHWSIDDRIIGDVMRLVQSLVCKHAGLVWIHHSNKGNSSSTNKAAGVTDIIELVSAAIQFNQEWTEDRSSKKDFIVVQKLRGGTKRSFEYSWSWEGITVMDPVNDDNIAPELAGQKSEHAAAILIAIHEAPFRRLKSTSIETELMITKDMLSRKLTELKKMGLVKNEGGHWKLTVKGMNQAEMLGTGPLIRQKKANGYELDF